MMSHLSMAAIAALTLATASGLSETEENDKCMICVNDPDASELRYLSKGCPSGDACLIGRCVPETGECVYDPKDCGGGGDLCTVSRCDLETGECVYDPKDCGGGGDPCTMSWCDPETGACVYDPKDCGDGDPCTVSWCDRETGTCERSNIDCTGIDLCYVGRCDPETGKCAHTLKDCDDGDAQTRDECDSLTGGCRHYPINDARSGCDPNTGECPQPPVDCDPRTGDRSKSDPAWRPGASVSRFPIFLDEFGDAVALGHWWRMATACLTWTALACADVAFVLSVICSTVIRVVLWVLRSW